MLNEHIDTKNGISANTKLIEKCLNCAQQHFKLNIPAKDRKYRPIKKCL